MCELLLPSTVVRSTWTSQVVVQVKCFYCDGGLREWRAEDDPWEEHAGWFRDCGFVRLVRGDTFVEESVQAVRSTVVGGEK